MLLTKEVEVKPTGTMIEYYKSLGYDAKFAKPLMVKVEDLPHSSNIRVFALCDYCNSERNPKYVDYYNSVSIDGTYACAHCAIKKAEKTNQNKYGVPNYASTKEYKEKVSNTLMERYGISHISKSEEFLKRKCENNKKKYGVEHTMQVKEFRDKGIQTNIQKYGVENVLQNQEIREKMQNTVKQRYGVPYASQSREIKEKILQTNLERYGCKTPAQLPEVRAKITQTLYANSSQKASKQQRYINNLYQGILNFPVKYYCADVFLSNDNLIVEYDGSGHMLNVTMGRETIEEYNRKEIVRYNVLKNEGYKQMKIISKTDKLPSDQILLQMLSEAKQYFSEYPNHSWCEYNLDTFTVRNAEHKNGIPYSFGELRKIKDSDLPNNNNTILKGA